MNPFIKISLLLLTVLATSCSKNVVLLNEKVSKRKTNEIVNALDSLSQSKPLMFYTRSSTRFSDTTQNLSFKTSIRMKKDSAINALITFAGLPIFHTLLTKDTLTISNKRSKCYSKTNLSFFQSNFGYPFDYKNIEELILGLPLAYDSTQRYYQINNPYYHILSSHRKGDLRKNNRKEKFVEENEVVIKYYLNDVLNQLQKMEIESVEDNISVVIDYEAREIVQGYDLPKMVKIKVTTPKNTIHIQMEYEKTEVNTEQNLNLIIPVSYEVCP